MSQGSLDSAPPQAQSLSRRLVHRSSENSRLRDDLHGPYPCRILPHISEDGRSPVHDSGSGNSFLRRNTSSLHSPQCQCAAAIHLETEGGGKKCLLRRAGANLAGSNRSPPISEKVAEEEEDDLAVKWCDLGMSVLARLAGQMEYSGGGTGKGKNVGRGRRGGDGDHDDNRRISIGLLPADVGDRLC
ncbi:hypothetical protein ZIOFF_045505 [Zingiber officinale]|uniref:Uncharacterized protein n=1 Tax=Zingiber officinale TaxID=94328 RepID=A0A8J5KRV1_ZINOF|nr:hypothetical protein ZIOFF_045505 [Zingiber officinale]